MEIVKPPHPALSTVATPVEPGYDLTPLLSGMRDALRREENGVGLAAPQVGVGLRVILVKLQAGLIAMVNPEIITRTGVQSQREGCLSPPFVTHPIERATRITVRYLTEDREERMETLSMFDARIVQHEIDHLDGKTLLDYMKPMAKKDAMTTLRLGRKV